MNETPLLAMCMILICGVETLRNRVGHTLILVLQLTQFPGRKGRWNRKVARSAEKYCLTKVYAHLQLTTRRWRNERRGSSAGKGFGEDRARTMNQKNGEVESQLSQKFSQVHSGASSTASPPTPFSLDGRCQWCPVPLGLASRHAENWKNCRYAVGRLQLYHR